MENIEYNSTPENEADREKKSKEYKDSSNEEKGASDIDIKQRDAQEPSPEFKDENKKRKKSLAPSGDMITNTGADIGSKGSVEEGDAATG